MKDQWISVEDGTPKPYQDVLMYVKGDDHVGESTYVGYFTGSIWSDGSEFDTHYVTHWQPLPNPPKSEK